MTEWNPDEIPEARKHRLSHYLLFVARWIAMATVIYGLLLVLLLARLLEFPWGRPVSPGIVVLACKACVRIMSVRVKINGVPDNSPGAVVANHVSWLDIFVLNSIQRVFFVPKLEVAGWFGIGILARATGAEFVERNPRKSAEQKVRIARRLGQGHRLLFFPEGTSSDGLRVLPFKSTLFAAFFTADLRDTTRIQPVTITYSAPDGEDPRFYGYWGPIGFSSSFFKVLASQRSGSVEVTYHEPLNVSEYADRKAIASHCETIVRGARESV